MDAAIFEKLQKFYRKTLKRSRLVRELVFAAKIRRRYRHGEYCTPADPTWHKTGSGLKLAVICDELTWLNLKNCADVVYLTPKNWLQTMEAEHPDLFFCEAAWNGLNGCWQNEILRSREFRQENRRVLLDILQYCRQAEIPSVFWNKEDTPSFDADPHHFVETALLFDHIFTTTEECIAKYRALGHNSVHLMMFGFLPEYFYPTQAPFDENTAVFLGSWYANHPQRCSDMRKAFTSVLDSGLTLKIYDRYSAADDPALQYPPEFQPYVQPAVPYAQTGDIMRSAGYVININTVTDSRTMFARRVFEAMACGKIVISNDSLGMRHLFGSNVWFVGEPFNTARAREIAAENLKTVNTKYTFRKQLTAALQSAGLAGEKRGLL